MTIKVCGLKDAKNLLDITALNIDMIGYNFYPHSPRYVDHLLPDITENIKKVGVFVNATLEEIAQKMSIYELDYAQLHGDENLSFVKEVNSFIPVIKVFRISHNFEPAILQPYNFCNYYLFDTATVEYGGSGQKFDWDILSDWKIDRPFLLSGGIGPENVANILKFNHPNFEGIDINSKFESKYGVKDLEKVRGFVKELRIG